MRKLTHALALAAIATAVSLPAAAYNEREDLNFDAFVVMCDTDKDGMVSKSEAMRQIEKMFDKHDTRRAGKLDKKQVEHFLRELMKSGA
jgi:hypothetical protein